MCVFIHTVLTLFFSFQSVFATETASGLANSDVLKITLNFDKGNGDAQFGANAKYKVEFIVAGVKHFLTVDEFLTQSDYLTI